MLYHGRGYTGTRISTGYPSTTPVGLALGPDSPWEDQLHPGTLSHPAGRIFTYHSLLMPAFSLAHTSTNRHQPASHHARRSPTQKQKKLSLPRFRRCTSAPLHCRRTTTKPVSYYALFQGWLLLSQPPGCHRDYTSFST